MTDLRSIALVRNDGSDATLDDWAGQVRLVVNVASKCGLTPQYEGLEALYRRYRDRGLVVLGFPANDFMAQEPGSDAEIASFCSGTFDVTFPLFAKAPVSGADKQPLFAGLIVWMYYVLARQPGGQPIGWIERAFAQIGRRFRRMFGAKSGMPA